MSNTLGASPAFTMTGRKKTKDETLSPGPGAYDSTRKSIDGPSYTMAGRVKDMSLSEVIVDKAMT